MNNIKDGESAAKEEVKLKNRELVLAFDCDGVYDSGGNYTDFTYVTTNGEISYEVCAEQFVVFDETYTEVVCRTKYPLVALAALEAYCEEYLG